MRHPFWWIQPGACKPKPSNVAGMCLIPSKKLRLYHPKPFSPSSSKSFSPSLTRSSAQRATPLAPNARPGSAPPPAQVPNSFQPLGKHFVLQPTSGPAAAFAQARIALAGQQRPLLVPDLLALIVARPKTNKNQSLVSETAMCVCVCARPIL